MSDVMSVHGEHGVLTRTDVLHRVGQVKMTRKVTDQVLLQHISIDTHQGVGDETIVFAHLGGVVDNEHQLHGVVGRSHQEDDCKSKVFIEENIHSLAYDRRTDGDGQPEIKAPVAIVITKQTIDGHIVDQMLLITSKQSDS